MIVKCNCDCKYCEEGICSKEEIIISDTRRRNGLYAI